MSGSAPARSSVAVIETRALTKRYGSTTALSGLDLSVRAGEVYGFLGPNGAGKTTTIRLLLWLHRAALVDRFGLDGTKRVRALSTGNRQKVALIAALCTRPPLLLLDEPTTGLDPLMQAAFREAVAEARDRGQTVLLSSHRLGEVEELCDRVGILRDGRLVDEGTLQQLRHLARREVEVSFAADVGPAPALAGVTVTDRTPRRWRLQVAGPVAPLIDALAGMPVLELSRREPSLEEIFLHHYRTGDDGHG